MQPKDFHRTKYDHCVRPKRNASHCQRTDNCIWRKATIFSRTEWREISIMEMSTKNGYFAFVSCGHDWSIHLLWKITFKMLMSIWSQPNILGLPFDCTQSETLQFVFSLSKLVFGAMTTRQFCANVNCISRLSTMRRWTQQQFIDLKTGATY